MIDGDRAGFMGTVSGPRAFRAEQRRMFDGLRALPLGSYRLRAEWGALGDLARRSDAARYAGTEQVAIPVTEVRYRLRGADVRPVIEDAYYTYVRRGGRWSVTSDDDVADLGYTTATDLWDFGRVAVQRRPRLVLLRGSCGASVPGRCVHVPGVAATVRVASARVDGLWPGPWPHRVVVIVPASEPELRRLLDVGFDVNRFVAFATYGTDRALRRTGVRVVVNPPVIAQPGRDVEVVLAHELTHVATSYLAGPFVPAWVDEGIAQYVGYDGSPPVADRPSGLPPDAAFTSGTAGAIDNAYRRAAGAVSYIVHRWGMGSFLRFYRRLGAVRIAPGTTRYHVAVALRRSIGVGPRGLVRAWTGRPGP